MNKFLMEKNDNGDRNDDRNRRNVPLPPSGNPRPPGKNLLMTLLILGVVFLAYRAIQGNANEPKAIAYSTFLKQLKKDQVKSVTIIGQKDLLITYKNTREYDDKGRTTKKKSKIPYHDAELMKLLNAKKDVKLVARDKSSNILMILLTSGLPILLIILVIWFFVMRQVQGSGNKALSFGKSKAKLIQGNQKKVTFDDVAGVEEAKQELAEVIDFLVAPSKYRRLGARIPKGVLLVGPPGTGKTLLARAVAGEADVPFFSISGSDFVEMFVGVGASRVRDLFEQGKRKAPCILFIDELDAVGRSRGAGYGGGHDEREQTLNQMLVEMDGFEANEGLIVVAATNRPDVLDPALLRPGRFDRQVVVDAPDIKGREAILKVHTKKVPVSSEVDLSVIARGTPGFTGADLENMVNEAALLAARKNKKKITVDEFDDAKDKVLMGPERRSLVINEDEKRNTAYHEAGHALLGYVLPDADPIHKVTIVPRGRALGLTQSLPIDERHTYTKNYLFDQIILLMGGRVAEEHLSSGNVTTGAANDIERATNLARAMVCEWGMSDSMGPLSYGQKEQPIFIGKEIARHKDYSEKVAEQVDSEIRAIVDYCHNYATSLISKNKKGLEALAAELLAKEVVDAGELEEVMKASKVAKLKSPVHLPANKKAKTKSVAKRKK